MFDKVNFVTEFCFLKKIMYKYENYLSVGFENSTCSYRFLF